MNYLIGVLGCLTILYVGWAILAYCDGRRRAGIPVRILPRSLRKFTPFGWMDYWEARGRNA